MSVQIQKKAPAEAPEPTPAPEPEGLPRYTEVRSKGKILATILNRTGTRHTDAPLSLTRRHRLQVEYHLFPGTYEERLVLRVRRAKIGAALYVIVKRTDVDVVK
jgi:hypothetical protein